MRVFVIGDQDTVIGFRFAGVEGTVVESQEQAAAAFREAVGRQDAVLIVPQQVAEWIRKRIDAVRFGAELPLIVEVPGREGPVEQGPSLFRLIRDVVGIKFES